MKKMIKIAALLATLGAASHANAAIVIDPDGAGNAFGNTTITTLNWLAGNAVSVGAGGLAGQTVAAYNASLENGTAVFTTYYQAQLNTFVNNVNGNSSTYAPVGQWTVQATFYESAFSAAGSPSIALIPLGGTVSMFYNPTAVANDNTGLGYNAGTEILRGTISGGSGSFTNFTAISSLFFPTMKLDNFGTDNKPGVTSVQGNGQSTLQIDIGATAGDFINPLFFKTDITGLVIDSVDTGQLVDPFYQANPSTSVMGYTPTYGAGNVNGTEAPVVSGTFTRNSDFQFQTTNVTSFYTTVPEPGTMAIAGLGLGLMGVFSRRRKSA